MVFALLFTLPGVGPLMWTYATGAAGELAVEVMRRDQELMRFCNAVENRTSGEDRDKMNLAD